MLSSQAPAAVDKSKGMGGGNGPDYQHIHRNKRSLTLNLKEKQARCLMKLIATADVVVENYRPDVNIGWVDTTP